MSLGTMYLHNLAKRAINGGSVHPMEIKNCPKVIDQVYGDGNGILDIHDLDDIASNVVEGVVDTFDGILDVITSFF